MRMQMTHHLGHWRKLVGMGQSLNLYTWLIILCAGVFQQVNLTESFLVAESL
jgi:hypothetical protein